MTNFMAHRVIARFRSQHRLGRMILVAVLVATVCTLLVSGSPERPAAAQSETQIGVPATGNIRVRDGTNSGEVVISWDYVPGATHYRIGYVNLDQEYDRAVSNPAKDWKTAFVYVDEDARNLVVVGGRVEYTVRRLGQGDFHAFTVLSGGNVVNDVETLSGDYTWPQNPRWRRMIVADRGGACSDPAPVVPTPISLAGLFHGAWLEEHKPALANRIKQLSWVADGVDDTERDSAEKLIESARALRGSQHGYRVRMWMCEADAVVYGQDRLQTLRSFRAATQPSTYYGQFLSVKDVVIKAKDTVDPDALYAAGDIVSTMLSGRQDIGDCMANVGAGLAIIPKDEYVTTLPEFTHLIGTSDFTGRPRDSFAIRGLGATKAQPVSATSEEQLLGLPTDQYPHNRFPHIGLITVHEFAHGIQNLCFTQNDWELWKAPYDGALQAGIFPGTHMMNDVYEFFAVLRTAYFEVTDEIGRGAGRDTVARDFPDVFESLEDIYGGAVLAAEYRERRF